MEEGGPRRELQRRVAVEPSTPDRTWQERALPGSVPEKSRSRGVTALGQATRLVAPFRSGQRSVDCLKRELPPLPHLTPLTCLTIDSTLIVFIVAYHQPWLSVIVFASFSNPTRRRFLLHCLASLQSGPGFTSVATRSCVAHAALQLLRPSETAYSSHTLLEARNLSHYLLTRDVLFRRHPFEAWALGQGLAGCSLRAQAEQDGILADKHREQCL